MDPRTGERPWRDRPGHRAWLEAESARLLGFAAGSRVDAGFGWLDETGSVLPGSAVHTWITARMTHVFAVAHLRGVPGAGPLADHGVSALAGALRDADHGGWYPGVDGTGRPLSTEKTAYDHAFVLLAAASARVAGRPGAAELLAVVEAVLDARFWDRHRDLGVERWDRAWTAAEPYRGANSSMHLVEAGLAAAHATGDSTWTRRSLRIAEYLVHGAARRLGWRVPEHFTADWQVLPEYNADAPDHPFRPYGTTPGHALEWARLLLHLETALPDPPGWLVADARELFAAAVRRGWAADDRPGFVYTLDWQDHPVVPARMHWVLCEGIAAAAALHARTGDDAYERWYRTWWDEAAANFLDRAGGGWHHELDERNRPASRTWSGKPDVYHAYQATLLPLLPPAPGVAAAAAAGVVT